MSSKAVSYIGKKTTGHGQYKPRASKPEGSLGGPEKVFVNNKPVLFGEGDGGVGSNWEPHTPPPNDHHARRDTQQEIEAQRTSVRSDATVFVNNNPLSRVGDDVESSKADGIAGGSANVFAGDERGVDIDIPAVRAIVVGDDHDVDEPGSGHAYIQAQINAGIISTDDIKKEALMTKGEEDTTPPKPTAPLSKTCSDIASITPFPSGNAIDDIQLTDRYTVGKLTRKPNVTFDNPLRAGVGGLSLEEIVCNLKLLAVNCIEPIRAQYPTAFVTNTWRPPGSNAKSQHPKGMAADIQFRGLPKAEYYAVAQWVRDNVAYDQLLLEYKTTGTGLPWIHVSFNKDNQRKQVLTLLNDRTYGQGLIQLA